jgi:phage gp36-like protein
MPLITITDMKTHIYQGVQNIISEGDNTIIQSAINAAIAEAKGYCSRYQLDVLFDNPLPADPILTLHVKNMAKWHFLILANPSIDYEDAQLRYDRAIAWLKDIQAGKIVPIGWYLAQPENESGTYFHVKSNTKRKNHY